MLGIQVVDVIEAVVYGVIIMLAGVFLERRFPGKSVLPWITTTILGFSSQYYYWTSNITMDLDVLYASPDPSTDPLYRFIMLFTVGHMLGDTPLTLFGPYSNPEKFVYFLHHIFGGLAIASAFHFGKWANFMIFMVTTEISNFFFNSRELVPKSLKVLWEVLFAVAFLGWRMGYLFPVACWVLVFLVKEGRWEELGWNCGIVVILGLHVYWCYQVVQAILQFVTGKKKTE
eukprot:TRINITY_DN26191_c0_g1_i1.p1 TRINITY_DN26191_c0_g1~~TRINITY_DN26191_c0_g1_i1.p1  ORF type:complete len:242 (-),score=45.68 TRINITY_DN26191_c0_g1_i1:83-772(-)